MPPKRQHGFPLSLIKQLPALENCQAPLLKCFWALKAAKMSRVHPEFIDAAGVSDILLNASVSLTPLSVERALARAGDGVARRSSGQKTEFRIMSEGEEQLEEGAGETGPLTFHVTGKAPWSDRRFVVKEAMKRAVGEVLILDKYFGMESLDFLQGFKKTMHIRFLTCHPSQNLNHLQREIARFRKEFSNSNFRAYPTPQDLHDRYLLFDEEVWFVGHGIKDIGLKESFVVVLGDPFGKDIRKVLQDSFEVRWAVSPVF